MNTKQLYMAPAMGIHTVANSAAPLLASVTSPTATFTSAPGVGEAGDDEEIGTESRRTGHDFWDE